MTRKRLAAIVLTCVGVGLIVLVVARLWTINRGADTADILEEARSRACACHDTQCADRELAGFMALLRSRRLEEIAPSNLARAERASIALVKCLADAEASPQSMADLAEFLRTEFVVH